MPIVSTRQASAKKLPSHHFCLVVGKTAKIKGKKLLSSQLVVWIRGWYKRFGLKKRQKSFKVYGHEIFMSLQTRAKFFGTHILKFYVSDIGLSGK
jgi:hypothetical protein